MADIVTTSISWPRELLEELDREAEAARRNRSNLVQLIVEDWLERRKIEARLREADSGDATFIPHGELDAWMKNRRTQG